MVTRFIGFTVLATGCTANLGTPSDEASAPDGRDLSAEFSPAPAGVIRLTADQYRASLKTLLGDDVPVPSSLEKDIELAGFTTVGAQLASISERGAEDFETSALAAAAYAFGEGGRHRASVTCATTDRVEEECARQTLRVWGRRLFRRELQSGEEEPYVHVFRAVTDREPDGWKGLQFAFSGLLQSPQFLFRFELGEPIDGEPDRVRYTSVEMASRLAFALLGHGPDEDLLKKGADGVFAEADAVRATARDMLTAHPEYATLHRFWLEYLDLDGLQLMAKDATLFPSFDAELPALFAKETQKLVENVALVPGGDATLVISSRRTFVDGRLAQLYGLDGISGATFQEVELPPTIGRRGFLGQSSFLAAKAHVSTSSPTLRGKFVRERLLCEPIRTPPPDIPPLPEISDEPMTTRARLEQHRQDAQCAGCHSLMDPIGVAFESFDAIGSWRDTDDGLGVDSGGDLDGEKFANADELVELLANDPRLGACMARQLFRFIAGHIETRGEKAAVAELEKIFSQSGHDMIALLPEILASRLYREAARPAQ